MTRILTLSQTYPPEPADIRVHYLGRDLAERGYQVTAITGFPNYPQGVLYSGYRMRFWQREPMHGVNVLRLPLYPDHSQSAPRRSLNYLSFAASATLLGPLLCGPADLVWAYQPPLTDGIPGWWLSLLRRVPFAYEIQDMWPETVAATGMLTSRWPLAALGRLARFIYRRADAIIVISPGFRRNLLAKGVPADKIHVIPNWADEDIYRPLPADPRLAEENGMAGRFNVVFAGNLGAAQALENVLNAAQRLRDLSSVQFVFIGSGVEEEALHRRAAALRLDNVRFLGRMPADRMPHFLALADVLLVHLRRDPLFEITIPSKTISYLAVGRPILSATAGDAAEVIEQAGAGLVCPPEDAEALETCVRKLFALPPASRDGMGRRGRAAFEQNYTRRVLIPRYEQLFAAMIERRHHREADRTEASGKAQA